MTDSRHCSIHGDFRADYPDSCPSCYLDEDNNDRFKAYLINNPGDYACPKCLYITLKAEALRCPKCHADIETGYWRRVWANEKEAQERTRKEAAASQEREQAKRAAAAAEWERTAPERAARDVEEQRLRRNAASREYAIRGGLSIGPFFGAVLTGFAGC